MATTEEPEDDPFPSGETTPELKSLPSMRKYAFLDHHCANPVIISSQLDQDLEERLLAVLRGRRKQSDGICQTLRELIPLCARIAFS